MEKEIQFKAKRKDNGTWACGHYVRTPITTEFECDGQFLDSGTGRHCIIQNGVAHEIDVDTLTMENKHMTQTMHKEERLALCGCLCHVGKYQNDCQLINKNICERCGNPCNFKSAPRKEEEKESCGKRTLSVSGVAYDCLLTKPCWKHYKQEDHIKKATKEISKTFGRAIKRLGEEDWRERWENLVRQVKFSSEKPPFYVPQTDEVDKEYQTIVRKVLRSKPIIDFIRTETQKAYWQGIKVMEKECDRAIETAKLSQLKEIREKIVRIWKENSENKFSVRLLTDLLKKIQ